MDLSEEQTFNTTLFRFHSHLHYNCTESVRLGNVADGGWNACLAGPFKPKETCLVYSFGSVTSY